VTVQDARLRGDQWLPRRGRIVVHIGKAVQPQGSDFAAAIQLRDTVRAAMLEHYGEPDLDGTGLAGGVTRREQGRGAVSALTEAPAGQDDEPHDKENEDGGHSSVETEDVGCKTQRGPANIVALPARS
jgi:hypothetical protein